MRDGPELDPATQFEALYEREYTSVFRSILGIVLDSAMAEDLTQETFIRAYRARFKYKPTAPPGAWLHRIGVNVAISHLRRQRLARLLPGRLYTPPEGSDYDEADARSVVTDALEVLTPKLRAAVMLHFYQGFTREEVAAILGIPPGTVASRMAKAITLMRKKLQMSEHQLVAPRSKSEGVLRER
jgi:RNA polymerase sigma-70 factor (ECF subfamily)